MRREGMPQRMGTDPEARAATGHIARYEPLNAPTCQTATACVDKQWFGRRTSDFGLWAVGCGIGHKARAVFQPGANRFLGRFVERHEPLLPALAHDARHARAQIDVLEI